MKLSLVFPVYNEAASIVGVLDGFFQYCITRKFEHEILVINDGSIDATAETLTRFAKTHRSVRVIEHRTNQGYGAALRSGFAAASGDFIFFTDGDGQFSPADLDRTLPLLSPTTIVLGYRQPRVEGAQRRLNAALWGRLVGLLLGFRVRDLNCAWKVFPRSLFDGVSLTSNGAFINAELLYYARKKELNWREIPVQHLPRTSGRPTGANPRVIVNAFRELAGFLSRHDQAVQPSGSPHELQN